mgnify:CR=1 FL=1
MNLMRYRCKKKIKDFKKTFQDREIKYVGSDTIEIIPAKVYEYSPSSTQTADQLRIKLWIGERDGLIYKIESEFDLSTGDKPNRVKSVMKVYDFGADIKIERPL